MSQSLAKIVVHTVFSTQGRVAVLNSPIREDLYAYIAGVLRELESPALKVGGTADHVHILSQLSKNYALVKVVEEAKKGSSKWLKTRSPELAHFHWQVGYGAFSVSEHMIPALVSYIAKQEDHHRMRTFQEEYLMLLEEYQVPYDERYLWS